MGNNNAIVLCSGGLDSVVTAYYVKKIIKYKKIIIIFFNYGQKTLNQERTFSKKCANNLNADFIEIKLNNITGLLKDSKIIRKIDRKELKNSKEESDKFYVPFRNSLFIFNALSFAESLQLRDKKTYDIFVGFKCEGKEAYPDTTSEYLRLVVKMISLHNFKGNIFSPLIKKDKEDIVLLGKKLGVNFKKTYSCYVGGGKHCGTCLACRLRQEAFYWANIKDITRYKEKMKDFRVA